LIEEFGVRTSGPDARAASLSGGNQQKLVNRTGPRARTQCPSSRRTRRGGLDVQAARAVHDRIRDAAARGVAVLLYSSDLDEVMMLGQRIVVMTRGTLREARPGASRTEIGSMMLGGAA
jgi:simple sugar transport system ATP-binding protein